jgi:propionate CoA-transferase
MGNVNVSRFGPRLAGAGGFINISQNARAVVFAGTFSAKGLEVEVGAGSLRIRQDGKSEKFVDQVEQITFAGARAARLGHPVLYVTERCVLRLTSDGLELVEIAPGVDLQQHILDRMGFRPRIGDLTEMDHRIFMDEPMELRRELLHLDLPERIALDRETGRLFINFEKMRVRTQEDIALIRNRVEEVCGPLDQRVDVIVNYDGFQLDEDIANDYAAMVADLEARFYGTVTRYSGSAFLRLKLGETLKGVAPHLFETREAAQQFLEGQKRSL